MFFSDVLPGGGGTALAVGSHILAAQILRDAGEEWYLPFILGIEYY